MSLILIPDNLKDMHLKVSSGIEKVYRVLRANGYQVYLAGGCVRDFLLGVKPRDFDIATDALPDHVEALFPNTKAIGKAFGCILVLEDGDEVEVTTFRSDFGYQDGRRPDRVEFVSAKEDAIRRDFTINALFYDLEMNKTIDFVNGLEDLSKKRIRAVGIPEKRFQEDHLRLLRAIRFVSQLGFEIEGQTFEAIKKLANLVCSVSGERIHAELEKLLSGEWAQKGFKMFIESGLAQVLFPNGIFKTSFLPDFDRTRAFELAVKEKKISLRWNLFFIWLHLSNAIANETENLELLLLKYKFSNQEKKSIQKSLFWFQHKEKFIQCSVGELIEHTYDIDSYFGLSEFMFAYNQDRVIQKKWAIVMQRRIQIGEKKPSPKITADDLKAQFSGAELGKKLKLAYWKQLENE